VLLYFSLPTGEHEKDFKSNQVVKYLKPWNTIISLVFQQALSFQARNMIELKVRLILDRLVCWSIIVKSSQANKQM